MNRPALFSGLAALLVCASGLFVPANACIHGPEAFKGALNAEAYRGIIFHSGQREELILFTNLEFDQGNRPPSLGWVIAVPSIPDHYSTDIRPEIFDDAAKLIPVDETEKAMGPSFGGESNGLDIKVIKVGPYVIHRVTASGLKAVKSLNQWFKKNGFATKKEREMKFFIDNKYTFLCLKVDWKPLPKKNANEDEEAQALPPLRVSFKTDRPFFPLKFSSHQGDFSLRLMTFTEKPIDWVRSAPVFKQLAVNNLRELDEFAAQNIAISPRKFEGALKQSYADIIKEKRLKEGKEWIFNAFSIDSINSDDEALIKDWKTDFFLELYSGPSPSKVNELLAKAVKNLNERGSPNKKAMAELRKLGAKAIPAIAQSLVRSNHYAIHVVGLDILKDHPNAIPALFLDAAVTTAEDQDLMDGAAFIFRLGQILIARGDKRGLKCFLDHGFSSWSESDQLFGHKTRRDFEDQIKSRLEKATGLDMGMPGKLTDDKFGDAQIEWSNWWVENEKHVQWDPKKKLFVIVKK